MRGKRFRMFIRLLLIPSPVKRTEWIRENKVFANVGKHCLIMDRSIPLYPNLIRIGNNVHIASNVHFVTHDIIHAMVNNIQQINGEKVHLKEYLGCIDINDNVFIGSGTRILYDTRIGKNCIIGANSLVSKDIPDNSVAAGIPAKVICSFDDFIDKRRNLTQYPDNLYSSKEEVSGELVEYLWTEFDKKHGTVRI